MTATAADRRLLWVWLGLVVATGVSFALGDHGGNSDIARAGTACSLAVALVKVLFVGFEFMELRHAPTTLRLIFAGWTAVVGIVLVVLYLAG